MTTLAWACAWVLCGLSPVARSQEHAALAESIAAWMLVDDNTSAAWASDAADAISAARIEVRFEGAVVAEAQAIGAGCVEAAATNARKTLRAFSSEPLLGLEASLAVSIELGGEWIPMTREEIASPDLVLVRGLDSIGVRAGGSIAAAFASGFHARSVVASPMGQALSSLAARALGDPAAAATMPADLVSQRGVRLYRFESEHWAQTSPGAELTLLEQGGRLVSERAALDPGFASRLADRLIGHLGQRAHDQRWAAIDVRTGGGEPQAGRSLLPQRAFSLLSLERVAASDAFPADVRARARAAADAAWAGLEDPAEPMASMTAACLWLAGAERHAPAGVADHAAAALARASSEVEGRAYRGRWDEALVLAALASRVSGDQQAAGRVRQGLASCISAAGPGGLVGLLPWVAQADAELARVTGEPMVLAASLRETREAMWDRQFEPMDATRGSEPLVGGIVFEVGATRVPSSASLRPLAFAAWSLGRPELTSPDELLGAAGGGSELLRVISGLRFAAQLSVAEAEAYASLLPARVVGGVRRTVWDHEVRAEDTAAALLLCVELLESLAAVEARQRSGAADDRTGVRTGDRPGDQLGG